MWRASLWRRFRQPLFPFLTSAITLRIAPPATASAGAPAAAYRFFTLAGGLDTFLAAALALGASLCVWTLTLSLACSR